MKSSRFKYEYRDNASKLHKKVGDILREGMFSNHKVYQEYPVCRVNPDYTNTRHHFDWVIKDLAIVIEVHGEQHFQSVRWGNISVDEAEDNLIASKVRDLKKQMAAQRAGYTYIMIPCWDADSVCESYILERYIQNKAGTFKQKAKKEESEYDRELKEKAKQYRKERYERQKSYLKQQKEG